MEAERCTHFSGNDTMALMLVNHPERARYRLILRGGLGRGPSHRPAPCHVGARGTGMRRRVRAVRGFAEHRPVLLVGAGGRARGRADAGRNPASRFASSIPPPASRSGRRRAGRSASAAGRS
jgi:hypothetical protein